MDDIKILSDLYSGYFGSSVESVNVLGASGGDRRYFRLSSSRGTCIGTVGDSLTDCDAFVKLAGTFGAYGVAVPEVYAVSEDRMHYLQQDLGDTSLFACLGTDKWYELALKTIDELVKLHTVPESAWGHFVGYRPFSRRQVLWDLNYFKYEYLKPCGIPFDEDLLQDDLERLADMLDSASSGPRSFMMRDCQSRNVMIYEECPYLIDFQGGRFGPTVYDIVSFLWQAKAMIPEDVRNELIDIYAKKYSEATGTQAHFIKDAVPVMALFRTLQVLGAYGFRGLVQKRSHFIESISPALANLDNLYRKEFMIEYPELQRVCEYAVTHSPAPEKHEGLVVKVYSFSYKRGYPEDLTGNGGGFMFDCRGMHNPGRYDEYKPLTGLDRPVRDFLEEKGEVRKFIDMAENMVVPSIDTYIRRGFSDLQVGFGCTGGRHRSVYCADRFAHDIASRYPGIVVELIHREQNITKTFNK